MSKPIVVEPEAEADIANAYHWYEERRAGLGDDFALCIEAALQLLAQRPRSFPQVRKQTRRILIERFPYLILFIERQDVIFILGIFHTARSPTVINRRARQRQKSQD